MAIDYDGIIDAKLQSLDEQKKRLLALKDMAKDPTMIELMKQIVGGLNGAAPRPEPSVSASAARSPGAIKSNPTAPNGLAEAVLRAAQAMRGKSFTARDLEQRMLEAGYVFVAKDHRVAISGVIKKATGDENALIKIVKVGKGGEPSQYEYIGR